MAATYADYQKSLGEFQAKLDLIRLKALRRKMSYDQVRLIQAQNSLQERKEQSDRCHWQEQQERTQQLQANLRAGLNNRWA